MPKMRIRINIHVLIPSKLLFLMHYPSHIQWEWKFHCIEFKLSANRDQLSKHSFFFFHQERHTLPMTENEHSYGIKRMVWATIEIYDLQF